jgi:DNA-binding CsgD family transcriptional regulator
LTDREREIVMLIGEGLSNRAVAERLTLSVRTVESHIYRAMLKTGTRSRDQLASCYLRKGRKQSEIPAGVVRVEIDGRTAPGEKVQ